MNISAAFLNLKRASVVGLAAVAVGVLPSLVSAQPAPSYARPYRQETIQGRVYSINGKYNITVRDSRGYLDNVSLHDGTVINPTGWRLEPGNSVTIVGEPSGRTFVADEIDTPYVEYPAYYPYPYPAYYHVGVGFGRHDWTRFGFGF